MITLPPFKAFLASNIPSVYDNTLTYYEELVKLIAYLEQQVVPAVNKNTADIKAYADGLAELKKYVDEYFDNLDIQAEIDAKLDDMAESGQLASIIAQFLALAPIFAYDDVASMIAAENLTEGTLAKTAGFHGATLGGGAFYYIRQPEESETANGYNIIELDNGLFAQLLHDGTINVDQYGAYGDGVHDDSTAIQFAISNNLHHTIYFSDKVYALGSTLKTYINTAKKTFLELTPSTKLIALNSLDALVEFGGLGGSLQTTSDRRKEIRGGLFDATNCDAAIMINENDSEVEIKDLEIINAGHYGIYIPHGSGDGGSSAAIVDGVTIYCAGANTATYGVYCGRPDNVFTNMYVRGCRFGMYFTDNAGGQDLIDCNGLGFGVSDPWFDDSCFLRLQGGINHVTNCYCDTFKIFADVYGTASITNCMYYSYKSGVDVTLFKIENEFALLNLANNTFEMPTPATYHKGIFYPSGVWNNQGTGQNLTMSNNIINCNAGDFNVGDLILTSDGAETQFWGYNSKFSNTTSWAKVGNIIEGNSMYSLDINILGKHFTADFYVTRSGAVTTVQNYNTSKNDDSITIQLGFVYQNNYNGYGTYGVYIRQTAGTQMWINPIIENKAPSKFVKMHNKMVNPTLEEITIDSTITI